MKPLEKIVAAGVLALGSFTYAGCAAPYRHVKSAEEIALSIVNPEERKKEVEGIVEEQTAVYKNLTAEVFADKYLSPEDMQKIGRHWRILDKSLASPSLKPLWIEYQEEAKALNSIKSAYESVMEYFARNAPIVYHVALEVKEKTEKELELKSKGLYGEEFSSGLTTAQLEEALKNDKHLLHTLYSLVESEYSPVPKGRTRELVVLLPEKYLRTLMATAGGQFGHGNYRIDSNRLERLTNGKYEDKEFTGNWGLRCYAPRGVQLTEEQMKVLTAKDMKDAPNQPEQKEQQKPGTETKKQ